MNAECSIARILVAGTDHAATAARALVIEFAGYHCEMAGSLEEVHSRLREECFELIVVDPGLKESVPEIKRVSKDKSAHAIVMLLTDDSSTVISGESDVLACPPNDFLRSLGAI